VPINAEEKWQQGAQKARIKVDNSGSSCQENSVNIVGETLHNAIQSASKEEDVIMSCPKVDAKEESLATADPLGDYAQCTQFNVSANAGLPFYTY
jgi:hypothetical protein